MTEVKYLTVSGLSAYLQMSKSWIYLMVARKQIPFVRLGTSIRFDKSVTDLWIVSRQSESRLR